MKIVYGVGVIEDERQTKKKEQISFSYPARHNKLMGQISCFYVEIVTLSYFM